MRLKDKLMLLRDARRMAKQTGQLWPVYIHNKGQVHFIYADNQFYVAWQEDGKEAVPICEGKKIDLLYVAFWLEAEKIC